MNNSWEIKNFEACIEKVVYTKKIKRRDFLEYGEYPIVSQEQELINGYWDKADDLFRIKKPVVIFGDHTQVLKYIDFDFVLGADGVKILQPKNEIDSKYFYYFLKNVDLGNLGYARHYRILKEIDVNYPKSIPEQKRIVALLDKAFAAIDRAKANAEKNLANAKELFESYLNKIFANPREDWEEKKIKEIGIVKTGSTPSTKDKENYGTFIPFIKPADFNGNGTLNYENFGLSKKGYEKARIIDKNSVLMVCIGASIGKTGFTEKEISCNQQINSLTPNKEFEPKFFYYHMLINNFQNIVKKNAGQATLPIINKTKWENLALSFPKLRTEQISIVSKLDKLSLETKKLETIYQQKLADLEEIKKSILQKAFNGEL